jgi:uncharacterized protein YxeA
MKKLLFILLIPVVAVIAAACNKKQVHQMTVVRDCTGTYLRIDQKDYQVCNTDMTTPYASGTRVKAAFKATGGCSEAPQFVCELYHPSEGWIKIVHIEEN